jgi:hypothetical protein
MSLMDSSTRAWTDWFRYGDFTIGITRTILPTCLQNFAT